MCYLRNHASLQRTGLVATDSKPYLGPDQIAQTRMAKKSFHLENVA